MTKRRDLVLPDGKTLKQADIDQDLENRAEYGKWVKGPWTDEPDKVVWVDAETDLDCMVVRNNLGALCGYVGVPEGHPWHGINYSECMLGDACDEEWCYRHTLESHLDVHGGVTFTASCQEDGPICHVPRRGRPHEVWWIGFDCAHAGDFIPGLDATRREVGLSPVSTGETYKDLPYVVSQVESLAQQVLP